MIKMKQIDPLVLPPGTGQSRGLSQGICQNGGNLLPQPSQSGLVVAPVVQGCESWTGCGHAPGCAGCLERTLFSKISFHGRPVNHGWALRSATAPPRIPECRYHQHNRNGWGSMEKNCRGTTKNQRETDLPCDLAMVCRRRDQLHMPCCPCPQDTEAHVWVLLEQLAYKVCSIWVNPLRC